MALTDLQRSVCRLIAKNRIESGESYVAGGVALTELVRSSRISLDIDIFHDTDEAVRTAYDADRELLEENGFQIAVLRERPSFVEAEILRGDESVLMQWARDSAYRFFPLVEHAELGLVLHPFDLATNKVLALVGRVEARDWLDTIECSRTIQPLGFLAWAACGKDPAFGPAAILESAARTARYSRGEIEALSFDGPPPDPSKLSRTWHAMVDAGRRIVEALPPAQAGKCVLAADGNLFCGEVGKLRRALEAEQILFHEGRIGGVFPQVVAASR